MLTGPLALVKGNNQNQRTENIRFPFEPQLNIRPTNRAPGKTPQAISERDSLFAANGKLLPHENACDGQREDDTR